MCGIVGYAGKTNVIKNIMTGLKSLEYRGYDSSGIAYLDKNNNIKIYKKEGYKKFNLGGIANINIDDNKYKGLNNFKQSFNPYIIEYMGDLEIITNSSLYFMYSNSIAIKNIIKK